MTALRETKEGATKQMHRIVKDAQRLLFVVFHRQSIYLKMRDKMLFQQQLK